MKDYKLKKAYTITDVKVSEDGKVVTFQNMYKGTVVMSVKDFNELFEEVLV